MQKTYLMKIIIMVQSKEETAFEFARSIEYTLDNAILEWKLKLNHISFTSDSSGRQTCNMVLVPDMPAFKNQKPN